MAKFLRLTKEETTRGAGRAGYTDSVIAAGSQPADIPNIINTANWDWVSPFKELGGTDGGIKIVKGASETEFSADQSDGPYTTEITGNTVTVNTQIIQVGDLDKLALAWAIADPITVDGVTGTRRLNIAAVRQMPERSLAIAEVYQKDETSPEVARVIFLARVANVAGDVEYNIAKGAQRAMALNLRAYADYDFGFGYILEEDGFGGINNS